MTRSSLLIGVFNLASNRVWLQVE